MTDPHPEQDKQSLDPADSRGARRYYASNILAVMGRLSFLAALVAILYFSGFGAPRLLYSYHVAHFAAIYVLTLTTLAAFHRSSFLKMFWLLTGFVTAVAVIRCLAHHHVETSFFDWIADVGGIIAALFPAMVQRFRQAMAAARPS